MSRSVGLLLFGGMRSGVKPNPTKNDMAEKYQIDWEKVDPGFCKKNCCAWMDKTKRCGTVYTTVYRRGKCMWETPRLKRVVHRA